MRILVIDDQGRTDRAGLFDAALADHTPTYLSTFPASWGLFCGYEAISWDNDLGEDGDVVDRLRVLCWDNPELFKQLFKDKRHIIHSANPVAASRMESLFQAAGARVFRVPIGKYDYDQINRNLTI